MLRLRWTQSANDLQQEASLYTWICIYIYTYCIRYAHSIVIIVCQCYICNIWTRPFYKIITHTQTHNMHSMLCSNTSVHMGVDQNKGSWEGYNRRSIANQSRPQRWQSRRDFVLSNVMCTENKSTIFIYIEIYTSHKLVHPADPCLAKPRRNGQETWAGNGPVTTFGGSSIAAQSRINRGFLDHMTWKLCLQKGWHADFSMFTIT